MTEYQKRVERTAVEWNRLYGKRKGVPVVFHHLSVERQRELRYFAGLHLRHGGRAPGEREHAMLRVSCDTCALSPCRGSLCEPYCFRRYDLHDAWRPKKGGAR